MSHFIKEDSRTQSALFPVRLENYISVENPIRVIDAFVDSLDLRDLKIKRADVSMQRARIGFRLNAAVG